MNLKNYLKELCNNKVNLGILWKNILNVLIAKISELDKMLTLSIIILHFTKKGGIKWQILMMVALFRQ
jgi:hypothetical protein